MSDSLRIVKESEIPFRRDNLSGPKYIVRGPNVDFGLVRILPGEDFSTHYHDDVEEIFYTLSGTCDIYLDTRKHTLNPGDVIQVPPKVHHYLRNTGSSAWTGVFVKSPYLPKDKVDVKWLPEGSKD